MNRSTMSHWMIRCSQEWLEPIRMRMHQIMMECSVLQGDETRIQCNKEPGKKASSESFMWVIRTGSFEPFRGVLFYYSRTRSGDEAKMLYSRFKGYLVTDAYIGYEKVEGIIRALCWSHLRRYYIESIPLDSSGREIAGSKGAEARELCGRLFGVEKSLKDLLVDNGTLIAQALGVPESVIALTFVALGTSLPELVTAITSLAKGHGALSLGNVIGANVFNLVLVSGVSAVVAPFTIPQNSMLFGHNASLVLEFPVMFAVMLLLTVPALVKGRLSRPQGIALLCIYAAFCVVQFTI